MAIIIRVNKKWNGMVAIRDKYLDQAVNWKFPLEIHCEGEIMTIPYEKVNSQIKILSQPIRDKFSDKMHKLVYYVWTGDKVSATPESQRKATVEKKKHKLHLAFEEANRMQREDPEAFFYRQFEKR